MTHQWQDGSINAVFDEVGLVSGKLIERMNAMRFSAKEEAALNAQ